MPNQSDSDVEMVATVASDNGSDPEETKAETREEREKREVAEAPPGVQAAYEFLGRKGITLWGDFIIADHHGRLRAARWLATEMAGVETVLREMEETG